MDKSNAAEYGKKTTVWAHRTNAPVVIEKEWGRSDGEPGDYIIVGPNDDAYMCNAELFESTYELLPGHAHKYVKTGTVLARKMSRDFMAETSTGVQHVRARAAPRWGERLEGVWPRAVRGTPDSRPRRASGGTTWCRTRAASSGRSTRRRSRRRTRRSGRPRRRV